MTETSAADCAEYGTKLNAAFRTGKTLSYEWRISQLHAMKRLLKENEVAIIAALGSDLGIHRLHMS